LYLVHGIDQEKQNTDVYSYIGGRPMLPRGFDIPIYEETGTCMTFFFQICMPKSHLWKDKIISVFCTTDYASDETLLPKLPEPLKGALLDQGFFEGYQTFFRFYAFSKTGLVLQAGYSPIIEYHQLRFSESLPEDSVLFGELDEQPNWLLEDETPRGFEGNADRLHFLFQTKIDYEYSKVADAPRQQIINYESSRPAHIDSYVDTYSLFVANELYFFGIDGHERQEVYLVPQS
jgi:hypothetical protein